MKKQLYFFSLLIFPCFIQAQNVGVGTTSPHPNAILEIKATNKGLLLPRGDADTRNPALKDNTAKGLLLFDTIRGTAWIHDGSGTPLGWKEMQDDVSGMWVKRGLDISSNNLPNGNVAIGLNNTLSRLQINGNSTTTNPVVKSLVTYLGADDVRAFEGTSIPAPGYGIGSYMEGGYMGVRAIGSPGASGGTSYGVYSTVFGTVAGSKYGLYANASGVGTNYGLYSSAAGGTNDWAGYFNAGNVYARDSIWLGKTVGATRFDMSGGQWDVGTTEGDFRIGNGAYRLKIGVATGGGGAGDVRMYASGGTNRIIFGSNNADIVAIANGAVTIGGLTPASGYKLSIRGKAICEEVFVQLQTIWPDYVFDKTYKLKPLKEVEQFINTKNHLPGIPSAASVKNDGGFAVGDMQAKLLEKIEELTLYIIQQQKEIDTLKKIIDQ
jgi:hypothetical protein